MKTKRLYWHALDGIFFLPQHNNIVVPRLVLKRQDVTLLKVHACSSYDWTMAADGTVPSTSQWSLSEYTGTPTFAIKTKTQLDAGSNWTEAWTGFYSNSLATGVFTMAVAPASTFDLTEDYYCGFQLLNGSSAQEMPDFPLPITISPEIVVGTETGAPSGSIIAASGTAQITAGSPYVDVTISGLTTGAVAVISLLGTSTDFTTLVYTPLTNTLRITPAAVAPAGGYYNVAYQVISL